MRQEQTGTMRGWGSIPFGLLLLGALAFGAPAPDTERATGPGTAPPTPSPARVRFAVIGDYGQAGPPAEAVARLVQSWNPDFVVTTGDNNYPRGEARTIDGNIGRYYHGFIAPYRGRYGPGADRNRFFPTLGNHDWATAGAQAYFDYFAPPVMRASKQATTGWERSPFGYVKVHAGSVYRPTRRVGSTCSPVSSATSRMSV